MARALLVLGVLACLVFGWHLYGVADVRRQAEEIRSKNTAGKASEPITVNPVTDVVTVPMHGVAAKPKAGDPFEELGKAVGSMLGGVFAKMLEPSYEREVNLRAREQYDVYAILLPYRVHIVSPADDSSS